MTRNAISNLFRTGTGWVVVLFLPPLLVRSLDKPTYGVWLLMLQIAAYIAVVDGGVQVAIARYVARADGLQDRRYLGRFLSSAGMILVASSLATTLLVTVVAWRLPHLFNDIPSSIAESTRRALLIVGISLALTLPFSVLAGFFVGVQKNGVAAIASSTGKLAGASGIAWAAYHHEGLLVMALWVGFGNILQCLMFAAFWRREGKSGLLKISFVERSVSRDFLVFCSAMFVSQLSSILITGMDLPIVAAYDFRSVAYYGVAATVCNALIIPHSSIVNTLMPVAAGMSAVSDPQRMGILLLKTTRFATVLLCLVTIPLLLLMQDFLRIWVGRDYASHALILAEILVTAQFIRLVMTPYAMIVFAAGQQQRMLVSPVVEGGVNLVCSLVAVQFIGARGVALGTLVGAIAGVALHFMVSISRTDCVRISRVHLVWQGILKPIACSLPLLLCGLFVIRWCSSPLLRVMLVASTEAAMFVLFWSAIFDSRDREQLMGLLLHFTRFGARLRPAHRA